MSNVLLVLTVGQTDVQLVEDEARRELCATLHKEIESRPGEWRLLNSPREKAKEPVKVLPAGAFALCTPKLDAILKYLKEMGVALTAALILETRRDEPANEPRFAGAILEARLREQGIADVRRVSFLSGTERLQEASQPRDVIIRREVVNRIDDAIRKCLDETRPAQVVVSATGGFPVVSKLVDEIVRLYVADDAKIDLLDVPDGAMFRPPREDRAESRQRIPEPAASYQARRHALALIQKGNLLGAWGAVQHLDDDESENRWTRVVKWLADFAASQPMPAECDIPVLTHKRMAVRAALRVEFALCAGDIPRAIHGTVAFFESALWDHLKPHLNPHPEKRRLFAANPPPCPGLVRGGHDDDRKRPFLVNEKNGVLWYQIIDDDICGTQLAKYYLKRECLLKFSQILSRSVRIFRNDVAHNEPTPELMDSARGIMTKESLWSPDNTFLTQPLVQGVLGELDVQDPKSLCASLLSTVRARFGCASGETGQGSQRDNGGGKATRAEPSPRLCLRRQRSERGGHHPAASPNEPVASPNASRYHVTSFMTI